jgi:hypothetical protein
MKSASTLTIILFAALALGVSSCCEVVDPPPASTEIVVDEVASGEAVTMVDTALTYVYRFAQVNPDSVLRALVAHGIPVVRGWEAIDYLCKDAIGPRFTIELASADGRIGSYDFDHGNGRLGCSTKLRRYTVKR